MASTKVRSVVALVNGDPLVPRSLERVFGGENFDVLHRVTHSLEEARELIPDAELALLDLHFDEGSTLELCRALRDAGVTVPMLFLSYNTCSATVARLVAQAGGNGLISKELDDELLDLVLVNEITTILASRSMERSYQKVKETAERWRTKKRLPPESTFSTSS